MSSSPDMSLFLRKDIAQSVLQYLDEGICIAIEKDLQISFSRLYPLSCGPSYRVANKKQAFIELKMFGL